MAVRKPAKQNIEKAWVGRHITHRFGCCKYVAVRQHYSFRFAGCPAGINDCCQVVASQRSFTAFTLLDKRFSCMSPQMLDSLPTVGVDFCWRLDRVERDNEFEARQAIKHFEHFIGLSLIIDNHSTCFAVFQLVLNLTCRQRCMQWNRDGTCRQNGMICNKPFVAIFR